MKIAVAGTGYVGLVTGVCLAEKGHSVTCVDVDEKKIALLNSGKSPIFEPGLEELMLRNRKKLTYTTDYRSAYSGCDVVFIGVGTPEKKDGSANLSYVFAVCAQIRDCLTADCIVVVKSTVPIGTNEKISQFFADCPFAVSIVSNPEFLAQGTAVHDTLYPSRIVIGADDARAAERMKELYRGFNAPVLTMNRQSAEMVKYASNDFLALKLSYINEIANLCEIVGADIADVTTGMGYDPRIGRNFLNAGIGYGGSCFPKDTKALHWLANYHDYELKTIKAAIDVNENQKLKLLKKARKYYASLQGVKVAVLGLTFKPNTDDLREAPSLINIPILLEDGAQISVYDPVGMDNFRRLGYSVKECASIDDCIEDAELCLIFTEWKEIVEYPLSDYKTKMKAPIVLDGRNCYSPQAAKQAGLIYEGIGRVI